MIVSRLAVTVLALALTAQSPAPAWTPIPMPTPPVEFQMESQKVIVTNMLYSLLAPYCKGDKIVSFALNNKAESPAYPIAVNCVHSKFRVDAPDKVTKLP